MFSSLKKLKNYYFPSSNWIAENFCKGKEIVFWRGFISSCRESEYLPKETEYDFELKQIGLYRFNKDWKAEKVILFISETDGKKKIESVIRDEYPEYLKRAAEKILANYNDIV